MTFSTLQLPPPILKAIQTLGYSVPTAIQEKAIPLIIAGNDIIGQSQTGSGKTAAFGLPILSTIHPGGGVSALILTPTRELCMQVCEALVGFAKHLPLKIVPVFGGVGIGHQIAASRTADVIVATPGRLLDIMNRGLRLGKVHYVVLDEADRMLDMGFINDVEKILRQTPPQRHTLLFSATLSPRLKSLVHKYMKNPSTIQTKAHVDLSLLNERAYNVQPGEKISLLAHLIKKETPGIAIVFCGMRHVCDKVARKLRSQNISAVPIHGGLAQNKRMRTIERLHQRGTGVLVATDVASRGIHLDNVSHVYNYDVPKTADDYTHRVGRTARAGAKGDAVTLVTQQDAYDFKNILRSLRREVQFMELPTFEKIVLPPGMEGRSRHGQRFGGRPSHGPRGGRGGGRHGPQGQSRHGPRGQSRGRFGSRPGSRGGQGERDGERGDRPRFGSRGGHGERDGERGDRPRFGSHSGRGDRDGERDRHGPRGGPRGGQRRAGKNSRPFWKRSKRGQRRD